MTLWRPATPSRPDRRLALLATLAVGLTACDRDRDREAGAEAGSWTLRLDQVVGKVAGDDEHTFGRIGLFAVAPDHSVFVLDLHDDDSGVKKYGPDGQFQGRYGRRGEGPGEYQHVQAVAPLRGGGVALRGAWSRRISVFDSAGRLVREWTDDHDDPGERRPHGYRPLLSQLSDSTFALGVALAGRPAVVRVDSVGEPLDTMVVPRRHLVGCVGTTVGDGVAPYPPRPVWTVLADGKAAAGCSKIPIVEVLNGEPGAVSATLSLDGPPAEFSGGHRDYEVARLNYLARLDPITRRTWKTWHGQGFPEYKPFFRHLLPTPDGGLWVFRYGKSVPAPLDSGFGDEGRDVPPPWRDEIVLDVFDPGLVYRGSAQISFPSELVPAPVVRGDTLWTVFETGLGVERIARLVLER